MEDVIGRLRRFKISQWRWQQEHKKVIGLIKSVLKGNNNSSHAVLIEGHPPLAEFFPNHLLRYLSTFNAFSFKVVSKPDKVKV